MNVLVLCTTTSKHNYANLNTFYNLIDGILIYDTGLTEEEIKIIKKIFLGKKIDYVKKEFVDFSSMRNDAIIKANDIYNSNIQWIIMPDDSYGITGITKQDLHKHRTFDCIKGFLIHEKKIYDHCVRIFKPNIRFEGKVNEHIITNCKVLVFDFCFFDTCPDYERSFKKRKGLTDWNNKRQAYFQGQLNRYIINKSIRDSVKKI